MRVVLDTNTLVSALAFHGEKWTWLREAWKSGSVVPLISSETTKELIRVLAYPKFRLTPDEQRAMIQDIVPFCETVSELGTDDLEPCRDPNDQVFLRLARAGNAALVVSGDDDLLNYQGLVPFRIVSPASLKTLLESS